MYPLIRPETAWGGDLGYEHRVGNTGVIGVNVFYREVKNLVELVNTGEEGSEGEGTFVLQPQNVGDGKVWGIEFDASRSEEHTSELQSLMRISYAVFCLNKKTTTERHKA